MSVRVHSNIGHTFNRRLPRPFSGTKALGTTAPNSLTGGPKKADGMAVCGSSGVVTFAHDGAGNIDVTAYFWSQRVFDATNGTVGWIKLGAVAAEYQKSGIEPYAAASITASEGMIIFLQGSAAADNLWMGGARKYDGNSNADLT